MGMSCWVDIEQTGKEGLFKDIAEGLKNAKVVIACVSDEVRLYDHISYINVLNRTSWSVGGLVIFASVVHFLVNSIILRDVTQ